jgi:hypothetical protein
MDAGHRRCPTCGQSLRLDDERVVDVGDVQQESESAAIVEVLQDDHDLRRGRIATVTNWELGAGDLAMPRAAKDRVRRLDKPSAVRPNDSGST